MLEITSFDDAARVVYRGVDDSSTFTSTTRQHLRQQLGNIYANNSETSTSTTRQKSTSTTRQKLKPGSATSSTSTTQQNATSTSRQRTRHGLCVPFLQIKIFRMTLRVTRKLGGYCRGYGTRVPVRSTNEAHQEEAQQADSSHNRKRTHLSYL